MARGYALTNAQIRTSDPGGPRANAMLILDGRIAHIGDEASVRRKARSEGVKERDLGGRDVVPGIIDSHTHLVHQGLLQFRIDLRHTTSLTAALARVRTALKTHPKGELLLAERWDESRWKERRYPHREDLDNLSLTTPIILRRVDGHIAVGNTAACKLLDGKTPGVDAATGLLLEEASLNLNQLFPTPFSTSLASLRLAQAQAARLGVTAIHDFVVPSYLRAFGTLHRQGRLTLRAHVSLYVEYLDALAATGLTRLWGDDRLRLAGIKIFADGSLGGHTAALHQPYNDSTDARGRLNWSDAHLRELIRTADAADLQVSTHAIGDAAIDQVAQAYAALPAPARERRHRIEHYELHTDASVEAMKRRGLIASMQPNFVGEWCRPGGMYHGRLGDRRSRRSNEFKRLLKAGVPVAFGSDCMPFDPWFGLESATHAPYPSQRLTFDDALAAYTRNSAYGMKRERDLGMLRRGFHADFVIARLDAHRPSRTHVLETVVGGVSVPRANAPK